MNKSDSIDWNKTLKDCKAALTSQFWGWSRYQAWGQSRGRSCGWSWGRSGVRLLYRVIRGWSMTMANGHVEILNVKHPPTTTSEFWADLAPVPNCYFFKKDNWASEGMGVVVNFRRCHMFYTAVAVTGKKRQNLFFLVLFSPANIRTL